jgi:hypothetical protein
MPLVTIHSLFDPLLELPALPEVSWFPGEILAFQPPNPTEGRGLPFQEPDVAARITMCFTREHDADGAGERQPFLGGFKTTSKSEGFQTDIN